MSDALVDRLGELARGARLPRELSEPRQPAGEVRARIAALERNVARDPSAAFRFYADGFATLCGEGRELAAGRFTTPTLGELRARLAGLGHDGGRVRVSLLEGAHALSDIGTLQALAPAGSVFQAASQFNCLEAPGPRIVPVHEYTGDPTQGPRASVSAFPATLLRHYAAPDGAGGRFAQSDARSLNLLERAVDPSVARVRSGYLRTQDIPDVAALAARLRERFDELRVGLHEDVEVVYGHDWGGPVPAAGEQRVSQVFTSTLALGGYSSGDGARALDACRELLRAAYLGTLLATAVLGHPRVVLTLIGGGVFGNPLDEIVGAIAWSVAELERAGCGALEVLVNSRATAPASLRQLVASRGGSVVRVGLAS